MKNKSRAAHGDQPTGQRLTTRCNVVLPENKGFHRPLSETAQDPVTDRKIIRSITALHYEGKPIYAYSVGAGAGLDNSTVSRWFRDHGIFWDVGRQEWLVVVPEMARDVIERLPVGAIPQAEWISAGWLHKGYAPGGRQ